MSSLILSGAVPTATRPNRKTRLAQAALARAAQPPEATGPKILVVTGCNVLISPDGPVLVLSIAGGQMHAPMVLNPEQAKSLGTALISLAAQFEMLKRIEAEEQAEQPVPFNPDLEALLEESQAKTAGPAPNSFDINGRPCYEAPAA